MPHYLSIHNEPSISKELVESRWIELARERRALWVKTWYNVDGARRFCWWDAPDKTTMEQIFKDHNVGWDEIIEVRLTIPSEWRWRED